MIFCVVFAIFTYAVALKPHDDSFPLNAMQNLRFAYAGHNAREVDPPQEKSDEKAGIAATEKLLASHASLEDDKRNQLLSDIAKDQKTVAPSKGEETLTPKAEEIVDAVEARVMSAAEQTLAEESHEKLEEANEEIDVAKKVTNKKDEIMHEVTAEKDAAAVQTILKEEHDIGQIAEEDVAKAKRLATTS